MHRSSPSPALRFLSLFAATLPLVGCTQSAGKEVEEARGVEEREVPPVRAGVVEQREMFAVLEATSKLESENEVNLFPELPGTVVEILAEEGDTVRQGDVLARLDHRDEDLALRDATVALKEARDGLLVAELAVEEAKRQVEDAARTARQAERDYERDVELAQSSNVVNPLSKQALEAKLLERDRARHAEEQAKIIERRRRLEVTAAQTRIDRAELALEVATLNRKKKDLVAPFDGVISMRNARVGDAAGTSVAAFVLTDATNLRATFSRPQEEFELFGELRRSAAEGEDDVTIRATAEAYPGHLFEGWVERISPTIDAASGQFRVVARLRPSKEEDEVDHATLLPGMLVRMAIVTDSHPDALVVAKRALRREGERRYVLAIDEEGGDATVRRVFVREGFQDEESVEVVPSEPGELSAGDRVVLIGSRELKDGDAVLVDNASSSAADALDARDAMAGSYDDASDSGAGAGDDDAYTGSTSSHGDEEASEGGGEPATASAEGSAD